ncbi:MAG: GntR family transcriptional regulator [Ferrovibrio sp.]|uniref:GntR family transcriptional regulator n=1 Tax=Ferrovibrio sp. TaxID=1917215 RepID=UPI00260E73D9|nr:GntR family transcriptional regulator [Ferrovibrio sp.]MCW0232594.1 GntR family transcriptional regulator [Ferrovibrio sp.]
MTKAPKSMKPPAGPSADVLQLLRDRIASQELAPGSKLRENDLAEEFNVSRARIREIFSTLEQRGLIERIPNRGAVVMRLEPKQVFEIYDVREVLEGAAVRRATANTKPGSWNNMLEKFGDRAEEMIRGGDLETYAELIGTFRREIIIHCDSPILTSMLDSLFERTGFLVRRLILVPGRALEGLQEHRGVLTAMNEGRADDAEQLKRANIRNARECFRRYQKLVL